MAKRAASMPAKTSRKPAGKRMDPKQVAQDVALEAQESRKAPMMSPATSTQTEMADVSSSVTHQMIAQRAFEIWREQGGPDMENWLQAERELRGDNITTV